MKRNTPFLCALLVGAAAALTYLNTLENGFTFDDHHIIVDNPVVQRFSLQKIFSTHYWGIYKESRVYRPLSTLSHAADRAFFGIHPLPPHLFNILIHSLNSLLAFFFFLRVSGRRGLSLITGLLFAVHPVHTEATANLVGRSELLSFFFSLLSLLSFWQAFLHRGTRRTFLYALSLLSFLVGLLSKENAAMVLPLTIFLVLALRPAPWKTNLRRLLPCTGHLLILLLFFALRLLILGSVIRITGYSIPFVDNPLAYAPSSFIKVLTALKVMGKYLLLLFFPMQLSADYSYDQIALSTRFLSLEVILPLLFCFAVLAAAFLYRKRAPVFFLSAGFFFISFLPLSNLFFSLGTIMGERLLYLPSLGFLCAMACGMSGQSLWKAKKGARIALLLVLAVLLLAVRTWSRNRDWKDDFTLFQKTLRTSPRSCRAHYNMGVVFFDRGLNGQARKEYRKALDIYSEYPMALNNLGILDMQDYWKRKKEGLPGDQSNRLLARAAKYFQRAVLSNPQLENGWINLGALYLEKKEYEKALEACQRALTLNPSSHVCHYNLGLTYKELAVRTGSRELLERAVDHLEKALEISPGQKKARIELEACRKTLSRRWMVPEKEK